MLVGSNPTLTNLESLSVASLVAREAIGVRDQLIRLARDEGATLRQIARVAQLSPQGVKLICDKGA